MAWNMVGKHADANSTFGDNSALRKIRPRPVRTLVAVTKTLMGDATRRSKLILSARMSANGLKAVGFRSYGEKRRDARSKATNIGELSIVQRPSRISMGPRRKGLITAALDTRCQNASSAARPPSAPPSAYPSLKTAAFMDPAEVPEMPSICSQGSCNKRSRTPQVKAPWDPPPCKAKSTSKGLERAAGVLGVGVGIFSWT